MILLRTGRILAALLMLICNENASSETIVLYNPAIPPVLHSRGMGEGVRFICESEVRKPFRAC